MTYIIWTAASLEKTQSTREKLAFALKNNNKEKIAEILRDMEIIRAFVINRNPEYSSHALLIKSFLALFKNKIELFELPEHDFLEVLNILREYLLPEQLIAELCDVFFHERNRPAFFYFADNIVKNQDRITSKAVIAKTKHDLASWAENVDKNNDLSLSLNREALGLAREAGDEILEKKIKFGLKNTKLKTQAGKEGIKPAERLKDYLEIAEFFVDRKCDYEAGRAYIEAAAGALDLARLQSQDAARIKEYQKNIDLALELGKKSLYLATKHDYTNVIIHANDVLNLIYIELGKPKEAEVCKNNAEKLRQALNFLKWIKISKIE